MPDVISIVLVFLGIVLVGHLLSVEDPKPGKGKITPKTTVVTSVPQIGLMQSCYCQECVEKRNNRARLGVS